MWCIHSHAAENGSKIIIATEIFKIITTTPKIPLYIIYILHFKSSGGFIVQELLFLVTEEEKKPKLDLANMLALLALIIFI